MTAHVPGARYLWPTGIPLPRTHPPFVMDEEGRLVGNAADWQEAHGGYVPELPKLLRDYERDGRLGPGTGARIVDLHCRVNAKADQWATTWYRLSSDYRSAAGWSENHNLLWREKRALAYAGEGEMLAGLVQSFEGPPGSGKSTAMLETMWWDFCEAEAAGFNSRAGLTGKWRRFGPWNYVPDILTWSETRKKIPRGVHVGVDDPLRVPDSENEEMERLAYIEAANSAQIQRAQGDRISFAVVGGVPLPDKLFTDLYNAPKDFRVPNCYGLVQRKEKGDTDQFHLTGFLLPASPLWDVGGPLAIGGRVFLEEISKLKLDAHARHFKGLAQSKPLAALDLAIARRPREAVAHCFTHGKLRGWLSKVLTAERGFTRKLVEDLENDLWQSIHDATYSMGRDKELTGSNHIVLFDGDGEPVAWPGNIPDTEECRRIVDKWRVGLQPVKPVDKEDWRERLRKHPSYRKARGAA